MQFNFNKILIIGLGLWGAFLPASAQDERELVKAVHFSDPSVYGQARGKGLSLTYDRFAPYKVTSTSKDPAVGNGQAEVQRFNRLELKLKVPVWNADRLKMVVGFRYALEEYNFERPEGVQYPLYQNLEDKDLHSIGGQLLVLKPLNEVNFMVIRIGADLNGDYKNNPFDGGRYLKSSFAAIYGWKRNEAYSYGVGLQVSYNFGRQSIYPAFMYNRTFNKRWGLEGLFPANLKLRFNASDYTYLYFGYNVQGNSYNINIKDQNTALGKYNRLEYRQTGILANIAVEREVFDFIWVGMEAGYRFNYRTRLVPEGKRGRDYVIDNKLPAAPYISLGLYIVTPRKWASKDEDKPPAE